MPIFDDQGLDLVGHFASVLGQLMGALGSALELALALPAEWTDPDWQDFATWVQDVFMTFYDWVMGWQEPGGPPVPRFEDGELDLVRAFGEALGAVMGGLRSALELALMLPAEWTEPASWDPFIQWVQDAFQVIMDYVEENLPQDPEEASVFEAVAMFGQALGSVMDGLQSALELALALPAEWTEPASWDPFIQWVTEAFDVFIDYVEAYLPQDPEEASIFEPVAMFGDALGAVFRWALGGPGVVPGLAGQLDAAQPGNLGRLHGLGRGRHGCVHRLRRDTPAGRPRMRPWIFEPVQAFGDALGAVFGGLVSALELFYGLQQWVGPGSAFQERLEAFLDLVLAAFQYISDYVELHLTDEQLTAVEDFGAALGSLVSGLSSGLSLFAALADTDPTVYTESNVFEERVATLLQAISGTLAAFQTWIMANADLEWIQPAQDFYNAVNQVFGLLRDGLQLFADLQAAGMPPTDLIQAFIDTLLGVFGAFATGLAAMAQPGGPDRRGDRRRSRGCCPTSPATLVAGLHGLARRRRGPGRRGGPGPAGHGRARRRPGQLGHAMGRDRAYLLDHRTVGARFSTILGEYYQHGVDLATALVDGMLSMTGEMYNAGYALAQAGLEGFDAGSGLGEAMAHAMASAAPEWILDAGGMAGNLTVNYVHTVRFEGPSGNPAGLDLTPRTVDAIARALADKVRRGG